MRRLILSTATVASAIIGAMAQPQVFLPETRHDFGAFSEEVGPVTCSIPVVNTGDEPLRIINARATCGCTRPEFDPAPVAPGDTTFVKVTYDPAGRPGRFSKKVYLYTNTTPDKSSVVIKGVVVGASGTVDSRFPVEAGPLRLRSQSAAFGEIYRGKYKTVFFEGYNSSTDTLRPYFTDIPRYLNVGTVPEAVPPGEQVTFTMLLNSADVPEWGINSATMQLHPDTNATPVEVTAVCIVSEDFSELTASQRENAAKISASPAKIDLGKITRGTDKQLTAKFTIANSGRSPLLIRRTLCVDPAVKTMKLSSTKIKPGKSATLTLTIDPALIDSDILNTRISIISNDPSASTLPLRVVATVTNR